MAPLAGLARFALIAFFISFAQSSAWAQESEEAAEGQRGRYSDADVIVAEVGQLKVRLSDIIGPAMAEYQKQGRKGNFDDYYNQTLQRRVERMLAANAAIDAGMREDEIHAEQMKRLEHRLLSDRYMQQQIVRSVSEAAVRGEYDAMVAELTGQEEIHARHIIAQSEQEASALKAGIEAGADFVEVAKAQSFPGAEEGGDLGYFAKGEILPDIGYPAFELAVGEISSPIKTPLGWHIVKVEDRRPIYIPPFEEVQNQIFHQLSTAARSEIIMGLADQYSVALFNRDGSPIERADPEAEGNESDAPAESQSE